MFYGVGFFLVVFVFDRVTIAVAVPSGILQADMCMPQPFLPPSTQRSGCTLPCSGSRKIVQEEELPERKGNDNLCRLCVLC